MLVVPRHRQVRSFETNVLVSLLGRVYVVFKAGDICIFREHIYIGRGYVYFFPPGGLEGPLGRPQKSAGGTWAAGALQVLSGLRARSCFRGVWVVPLCCSRFVCIISLLVKVNPGTVFEQAE